MTDVRYLRLRKAQAHTRKASPESRLIRYRWQPIRSPHWLTCTRGDARFLCEFGSLSYLESSYRRRIFTLARFA